MAGARGTCSKPPAPTATGHPGSPERAPRRQRGAPNLTADGFVVIAAADKPHALARLRAQRPDLVVCDVNGHTLGLLDAVRRAPAPAAAIDPDVPLIVLTARRDELARVRYLEHGCDDIVGNQYESASSASLGRSDAASP